MSMDIYIKPNKKALITGRKLVYLKDIGEVFSTGVSVDTVKNTIVYQVKEEKKASYLISVLDIIKALTNHFPESTITNLGEMDVVVEYSPQKEKENKVFTYLKVACIFIILFVGASTAIMSFHNDGEIPSILKNYYYIFFRENIDIPKILVVPYSLGLAVGITIFFNHFSKIYLTKDPTPIEVQMTTYENETITNIVDTLSSQKESDNQS